MLDGLGPDDLILGRTASAPWDHSNYARRILRPALAALGLPALTAHGLRHSAITNWIEVDRLSVQVEYALAGHGSPAFTLDRYGHLVPG